GRARADVELSDLADRRRRAEVVDEAGGLVHELAVTRHGGLRELFHDGVELVVARGCGRGAGGLHGRREERLEVAPADLAVRVLAGDHLALLREAKLALHAPRRLREDRLVAGPTAA